jgi:hypothetical protein
MTILYIVLLSVGVVYALVVLVTGGLHLHLPAIDFNHDGIIAKDSVGEIALVAQGGRLTFPAKSSSGEAINRNTTVVIEKVVGGIAFVRPQ